MTKRYKLDRVASVDNRPPPDKNFGPKQVCTISLALFTSVVNAQKQQSELCSHWRIREYPYRTHYELLAQVGLSLATW